MPRIYCPKCRRAELFNAQGKWRVYCSRCRTYFQLHVLRHQPVTGKTVICPHCGHREVALIEGPVAVKCPVCAGQFTFPG